MGLGDFFQDLLGIKKPEVETGVEVNKPSNIENLPVVYGRRRLTGTRVFTESSGSGNKYLYMVIALAEGECEGIYGIQLDDKPLQQYDAYNISSYPSFNTVLDNDVIVIRRYFGGDSQTADSMLTSALSSWTSNHTLSGVCYMAIRLRWVFEVDYWAGVPEITALVAGRLVTDIRTSPHTTIFSQNPALCLRDYLTNTRFGKGLDASAINDAKFTAAALDLDATETLLNQVNLGQPDSVVIDADAGNLLIYGTKPASALVYQGAVIKNAADGASPEASKVGVMTAAYNSRDWFGLFTGRYIIEFEMTSGSDFTTADTIYVDGAAHQLFRCNTVLDTSRTVFDNIKVMLGGMRASMPYTQGQYALQIEQDKATVFDFAPSHIKGGLAISGQAKKDKFNRVTVRYTNPSANWKDDIAIFPEPGSATETTLLAEDNGTALHREVVLETVTDHYQARDLARLILYKSRNNIRVSMRTTSEAIQLTPADLVTITHPTPGWNSKKFQILKMDLHANGEVSLQLVEHSGAIYTYDAVPADLLNDDTDLPNPFIVQPPTALISTTTTTIGLDGSLHPAILVDWTAADDLFVDRYEIQYRVSAASPENTWQVRYSSVNSTVIGGLVLASTYDIRVRSITNAGIKSPWSATDTHLLAADTTPPGVPTNLLVRASVGFLRVDWTNPGDSDFKYTEVYINTTDSIPGTPELEAYGDHAVVTNLQSDTIYYVWLKAVDNIGNKSAATSNSPTDSVLVLGDIVVTSFYQDAEPAGIDERNGDNWFDTNSSPVDNLAVRTGGSWVAADEATRLFGLANGGGYDATARADGRVHTFLFRVAPVDSDVPGNSSSPVRVLGEGDIWFDMVNAGAVYRYQGSPLSWQLSNRLLFPLSAVGLDANNIDGELILSNGNLTIAVNSGVWVNARSTIGHTTGKWAWECTNHVVFNAGTAWCEAGMCIGSHENDDDFSEVNEAYSITNHFDGTTEPGAAATNAEWDEPAEYLLMLFDGDANTLAYRQNGITEVIFSGLPAVEWFAGVAAFHNGSVTINLGGTPFNEPLPAGYSSWDGTQNNAAADANYPLLAPDGTVAAPSYSFAAAPGTGLYHSNTESPEGPHLHVSINATEVIDLDAQALKLAVDFLPAVDNTHSLGSDALEWKELWATDTTINSSDLRYKTDVNPCELGLNFILALSPISYRRPGGRGLHYGLAAQQVQAVLEGLGIDLADFAGLVVGKQAGKMGLRYSEFIAPLILTAHQQNATIQVLSDSAQELLERLTALEK